MVGAMDTAMPAPWTTGSGLTPPPPPAIRSRRFHWRWDHIFPKHTNHTPQPPPPDPAAWFTKRGVRCTGLEDHGAQNTSANCRGLCQKEHTCLAYNFAPRDKTGIATGDCWLVHNRTDGHECSTADPSFVFGAKRPVAGGGASCAPQHGGCSATPRNMSDGRQCFCDDACASQYDCCVDYVSECPQSAAPTTCAGDCDDTLARAVLGGGYCWCVDCDDDEGDPQKNCCPDYEQVCSGLPTAHICMDPRSHASAANLFLAAYRVDQLARGVMAWDWEALEAQTPPTIPS